MSGSVEPHKGRDECNLAMIAGAVHTTTLRSEPSWGRVGYHQIQPGPTFFYKKTLKNKNTLALGRLGMLHFFPPDIQFQSAVRPASTVILLIMCRVVRMLVF